MSKKHVVVVGAGMVGLSTAWYLLQQDVQVTVVDKTGVGAGSSWGNAGWLAPALTLPLPDPAILASGIRSALSPQSPVYVPVRSNPRLLGFLANFARHCTNAHWRNAMAVFVRANSRALDAYDEMNTASRTPLAERPRVASPFLAAFASESDREFLVDEFARVNDMGGSIQYRLVDSEEAHALEPSLSDRVQCGITLHDQRFINPGSLVQGLATAVKDAGGEVVTCREVANVEQRGAHVSVQFTDGGHLEADSVVLANGAWVGDLARRHGVRQRVQAGRGYSFTVTPGSPPRNPVYFPTQRVACTPLGDSADGLRVAGMMEFRDPDAPLDPRRIKAIVDVAQPMFTDVDWTARSAEWVGSRPCTADGLPLIGATRSDRVFIAGGHGMWGLALGPLTGKILADAIVRGRRDELMGSFDPLR